MPSNHIQTPKTKAEINRITKEFFDQIAGKKPDVKGHRDIFLGTIAHHLFTKIFEAYEIKSQGGTDSLGNSWKDLTPEYKAYGKDHTGWLSRTNRRNLANEQTPGLLTPTQYKLWKQIYRRVYMQSKKKLGETEAKKKAGAVAWTELKNKGAKTLIQELGDREIAILRDTDRLMNSYKPGRLTTRRYIPRRDQTFEITGHKIKIGSTVPYSGQVIKERPIIPKNLGHWLDEALEVGKEEITKRLIRELRR